MKQTKTVIGTGVGKTTEKQNLNKGQEMKNENKVAKKVVRPADMASHKETKQYKDETDAVESAKTVKVPKVTRAQKLEQFKTDIAKIAEADIAIAKKTQNYYNAMFQVESTSDFMDMVQAVDVEAGTMSLKTGFNLPVIASDDLLLFLDMFTSIIDGNKAPTVNIVKYEVEDSRVSAIMYVLFELLSRGRKTPQIEWDNIEADAQGRVISLEPGYYTELYQFVNEFTEAPNEIAPVFKAVMEDLSKDIFDVMDILFNRDSLKKLGISVVAPIYGGESVLDAAVAEYLANVLFDVSGDFAPEVDEDDEDEESEEDTTEETNESEEDEDSTEYDDEDVEDEESGDEESGDEEDYEDDEDSMEYDDEEWDEEDEEN